MYYEQFWFHTLKSCIWRDTEDELDMNWTETWLRKCLKTTRWDMDLIKCANCNQTILISIPHEKKYCAVSKCAFHEKKRHNWSRHQLWRLPKLQIWASFECSNTDIFTNEGYFCHYTCLSILAANSFHTFTFVNSKIYMQKYVMQCCFPNKLIC